MRYMTRIDDWLQIIRGEFQELPHLRLTAAEAAQRWDLDANTLGVILDAFVDARFLNCSVDGVYSRSRLPEEVRRAV